MKYINIIVLSLFAVVVALAFSPVASAQTYFNNQSGYGYYDYSVTNQIPYFLSTPKVTATVGEAYVYGVRAEDPNANPIVYSLIQAPTGMAIDQFTHVIVWTPTYAGTFAITVAVVDYTNQPALQSFNITVSPAKTVATSQSTSVNNQPVSFGIFGGSTKAKTLEISNIQVLSGPRNIKNTVSNANCGVSISWTTNIASVGQVVYGTKPQPDSGSLQYEQAAIEGSSPSTVHSVALPSCLNEQTYYFRVAGWGNNVYKISAEQTILPLPIEVASNSTAGGTASIISAIPAAGASIFSTLVKFVLSPILIMIILGLIIFFVVRKLWMGAHPAGAAHDSHESSMEEPIIAIPHH